MEKEVSKLKTDERCLKCIFYVDNSHYDDSICVGISQNPGEVLPCFQELEEEG